MFMKILFLIFLMATVSHCDFSSQEQDGVLDQDSANSEEKILQFIRDLFQNNPEPVDESLLRDDV